MDIGDDDICVCQHPKSEHHRSWFLNGYELVEECEYYPGSFNETGGMMLVDGKWIEHCSRFTLDKEANHGPKESPTD